MACDNREVTGAQMLGPTSRGRRPAAREGVAFSAHKKLAETDNTCEKAACNFGFAAHGTVVSYGARAG